MNKMMIIVGLLAASLTANASVKSAKAAKHTKAKAAATKAAAAKSSAEPKAAASGTAAKKNVSRDISFSGSQVDGKYLSAGESIAEVEGDKEMGALIGIRKNFHDRLNEEKLKLQANSSQTASSGKGQ